jgi:phosphatidylserine decarboxylase
MKFLLLIISLSIVFLYLFREPELKKASLGTNTIISPAYGKIYKIQKINCHICISIILTIFDVHYQYVPCDGVIKNTTYDRNGTFNIVYSDYDKTKLNEKMIYEIKTGNGTVYVYQIAGFFFRRIIPYVKEKQKVAQGDKLGLITFGSRVDICVPIRSFHLVVKEGQCVKGGNALGYYM